MNKKMKALTFSFDDGVFQDRRLVEIFDKYALKCTFNLNSGKMGTGTRIPREEIKDLYKNHEVAVHTVNHPRLWELTDEEIVNEVEDDRIALSKMVGYDVVGMAYPYGLGGDQMKITELLKNNTKIRYARDVSQTLVYNLPENLYKLKPTLHHNSFEHFEKMAKEFVDLKAAEPSIFYVWGHSYEFDYDDSWDRFEKICKLLSGRDDIFYGTNAEVFLSDCQNGW